MSNPSQVVSDAVAALSREDWETFISLCDPVSVRRFKSDLVWQFTSQGSAKDQIIDDVLEEVAETPRDSVEYELARMSEYRDPVKRLHLEISTVASVQELQRLEPGQVLLRWLQSRMYHRGDDFESLIEDERERAELLRQQYVVLANMSIGGSEAEA